MRSFVLIGLLGVLLASTSIAQAHNTRWAWTESKAAKMVTRDATVKLAVGEQASLTAELNDAVRLYGALVFAAQQVGDGSARQRSRASWPGTSTCATRCGTVSGSTPPHARAQGRRYRGTASSTSAVRRTSVVLEIPQTQLDYRDQELPTVIEG